MVESLGEVVEHADVLVIGTAHEAFKEVIDLADESKKIIDLVGFVAGDPPHEGYIGIGW
jgi:UDP-N-acetyl-D-mannosaminuronate dehydrogenase